MLLFIPLIALLASSGLAKPHCPEGSVDSSDGTKCYHAIAVGANFHAAQLVCAKFGGNLAAIDDENDNDVIYAALWNEIEAGAAVTSTVWIGASNDKGEWLWQDGEDMCFADWAPKEPKANAEPQCAALGLDTGKWVAQNCDSQKSFVCETDIVEDPCEASTTCPPPPEPVECPICTTVAPVPTWTCPIPKDWVRFENHLYLVLKDNASWDNSRKACQAKGGDLASIASAEEEEFVENLVKPSLMTGRRAWLGGRSVAPSMDIAWVDGTPFDYNKWIGGLKINNGRDNCAYLEEYSVAFKWNRGACKVTSPAVCKKSACV